MSTFTAKDVMNPQVLAVQEDMSVRELATFLAEQEITGAPVLDRKGHLVGVVSVTDIAQNGAEGAGVVRDAADPELYVRGWEDKMNPDEIRELRIEDDRLQVRDIMTPSAYTVSEDTPVPQIAKTMIGGRVHRLLVTRDNRVVGIITSLDMLKLLSGNV